MAFPVIFQTHGSGPPLLWIHGFPLTSDVWRPQFCIPGARHIAPDLPGFGPSPALPGGDHRIDVYAESLLGLLDDLRIDTLAVAGLSMGGYVALALVRLARRRVRALILVDTKETPDTPEGRKARFDTIEAVRSEGLEPLISSMLPRLLRPESESTRAQAVTVMRKATVGGVIAALEAMASREDSTDVLSTIDVPTLIVVGEEDEITPPADARRMWSLIPGSELVELPGAGHLSNLDAPEAFNQAVARFLGHLPWFEES